MRKIAICDDELTVCQKLQTFLEQFQKDKGEVFLIQSYYSGEELIHNLPKDTDILLLDIKMGPLSGMEAARFLRAQNSKLCIIFITTLIQYALEGYEVHAFGFLQKPVIYEPFKRLMSEALDSISIHEPFYVTIQYHGQTTRIDSSEIYYIETFRHNVTVVTKNGLQKSNTALISFEVQLKNHGFFRCHKSYLVNLKHIKNIEQSKLLMFNEDRILLSRHRKKAFMETFAQFVGTKPSI